MPAASIKFRYIAIVLVLLVIPVFVLLSGINKINDAVSSFKYEIMDKKDLSISLSAVNTGIQALSADPTNEFLLNVKVTDSQGDPVPGARFDISSTNGLGRFQATEDISRSQTSGNIKIQDTNSHGPISLQTGSDGRCLVVYSPPYLEGTSFKNGDITEGLTAALWGGPPDTAASKASIDLKLMRLPVILIPGYKTNPDIFSSMKEFLKSRGISSVYFSYDSGLGVAKSAAELQKFLDSKKAEYLSQGVKVDKFDIISHSMGGLVARYYTCSSYFPSRSDVNKLIFLSVPHMGSPLASLGLDYYNDQGIYDLMPDGGLFTSQFPSMINKGLNSSIQTGNILGQYDEAVNPESASLDEWGINTELFSVGDNNFTLDKLLSGKIMDAANHKLILYNKRVFERVEEMLDTILPYPLKR